MRKTGSVIYFSLLAAAGLIVVLLNPLYMYAVVSIFAFLAIVQQMNLYRMLAVMMKRYAKNVSRLRFEIRAKLHTGFKDYNESVDREESNSRSSRTCGFTR